MRLICPCLLTLSLLVSCAAFERRLPSDAPSEQPPVLKDKYKIEPVSQGKKESSKPLLQPIEESDLKPVPPPPIYKVSNAIHVGERYVYSAGWSLLDIGEIVVEVLPLVHINGRAGFPIQATGKTNKFFSAFYNAQEDINVIIDSETLKPYKFELFGRETKYMRHQVTIFDYDNRQAYYWRHTKKVNTTEESTKEITYRLTEKRSYLDSLSPIFSIRSIPLHVGKKMLFHILESAHIYRIQCQILREENKRALEKDHLAYYFECEGQKILSEGKKPKDNEDKRKMWGWISKTKPHYVIEAKASVKIGAVSIALIKKNN